MSPYLVLLFDALLAARKSIERRLREPMREMCALWRVPPDSTSLGVMPQNAAKCRPDLKRLKSVQ